MIHPHTEVRFISDAVGRGVVATHPLPKGTVVWVRDQLDRTFSPEDLLGFDAAHREVLDTYCYRNASGHYVLCWDHARFVNHSFRPNCLPTAYGVEIVVRDIAAGEEITNDYGCFNLIEPFRPEAEGTGRIVVRPDDLRHHHGVWDSLVREALAFFPDVEQALEKWMDRDLAETLRDVSAGRAAMRSLRELWFDGAGGNTQRQNDPAQ